MSTQLTAVLNQLSAGQISAEEAARLLHAPAPGEARAGARWLHIRVTDLATGRARVNVNLPLSWVEIGMKIGARHEPRLAEIDWPSVVAQVQAGAAGRLLEVEDLDDNERVEIFVD